jgi:hypothetical protein
MTGWVHRTSRAAGSQRESSGQAAPRLGRVRSPSGGGVNESIVKIQAGDVGRDRPEPVVVHEQALARAAQEVDDLPVEDEPAAIVGRAECFSARFSQSLMNRAGVRRPRGACAG